MVSFIESFGLVFAETPLDHFSWSAMPVMQPAGRPFAVELQARDVVGNPITNFNGPVTLAALAPDARPTVLITEIKPSSTQGVELSNLSGNPVDVSGWKVLFYDNTSWPSPRAAFVVPAGTVCPAGGVFRVNGSGFSPGSFPSFSTGVSLGWSFSSTLPVAVLLLDAAGNAVDFFCAGQQAFPGLIAVPFPILSNSWSGLPFKVLSASGVLTHQRIGYLNHHNAADWAQTTNTMGIFNQNLSTPFLAGNSFLPVSPSQVTLTNGQWSGQISVGAGGTNVILRADDFAGHSGDSAQFNVGPLPALALQIPHAAFKATPGVVGSGVVAIPQALSNTVTVTLVSSSPAQIAVPTNVLITAGQTNGIFSITNFNDGLLTGPLAVTVLATAAGFFSASDAITNYDQSAPTLSVSVPASVVEGAVVSGTVSSSAPPAGAVRILLSSTAFGRLQVPDSVILPAGQVSVSFSMVAPNNNVIDGNQPATISAFVPGWMAGQAQATVVDNEGTQLAVSLPSPVIAGAGVMTNAGIVSVSGLLLTNLTVNLTNDFPGKVLLPSSVTILAGQASASFDLTVPHDTLHDGNQTVTVTASASGFTSGSRGVVVVDDELSNFVVAALPSAQIAGQPFAVIVYAVNFSGTVLAGYSGTANLTASGATGTVVVQPGLAGPFTNGTWTGLVTISVESLGTVLKFDDGQGHVGLSTSFDALAARVSNLPVSDLTYDPLRKKLLAGVLGSFGPGGQSIMQIDPQSGATNAVIAISNNPAELAISSDSQYLYVAQSGTGGIARVNLASNSVDLRFNLGPAEGGLATELAVPPGDPHAVVAWRTLSGTQGLALYRDGVQSPSVVGPDSFFNDDYHIVFYDSATNFYSISSAGYGAWQINLTPNGPSLVSIISGFNANPVYKQGLLFSSGGEVIEPVNFQQLGIYAGSGLVAVEPDAGQVYFLSGNQLQIFDLATFATIGQLNLPISSGSATKLVSCGSGILAFATASQLYFLQSSMIPLANPTDLVMTQSTSVGTAVVGSNFTYTIAVSNAGPVSVSNTVMEDVLPADALFISATNAQGECSFTNGILRCPLGVLAPGSVRTTTVVVQPGTPGNMINRAWALGDGINPANGTSLATNAVVFGPTLPAITRLWFNSVSLAFDTNRNMLWAGVQRFGGAAADSLRSINLSDGLSQTTLNVGYPVGKIAVSADQNYLYAQYVNDLDHLPYTPDNYIRRANLVSNVLDLDFPVMDMFNQQHSVADLIGFPGSPGGIMVGRYGPQNDIALYQNGVAISRTPSDAVPGRMEINPAITNRLYRLTPGNGGGSLAKLSVSGANINVLGQSNLFTQPFVYDSVWANEIRLGAGLVFADNGMVADPEALTNITRLPVNGPVQTDPATGLVYYLAQNGSQWVLEAFDMQTYSPVWASPVPGVSGTPGSLTRCRPGILAFRTSADQLFILNTAQLPHTLASDVSLVQTASAAFTTTNFPITFTSAVSNAGPCPAMSVVITNEFPPDATVLSVVLSQGTATNVSNNVVCSVGNLPLGGSASVQITATLNHAGSITNLAHIVATTADPVVSNNFASAVVQFNESPVADLSITHQIPSEPFVPGGNFHCTLLVSNAGLSTATGVQLTDKINSGAAIVSVSASQGTNVSQTASTLTMNLGTINSGSVVTVNLTLTPSGGGVFQHYGQVLGDGFDPDMANNSFFSTVSLANTNGQSLSDLIPLPVSDIAFDSSNKLLVLSTTPSGARSNSIVGLRAADLAPIFVVPVTNPLGRVAVSDDGHYAYVGTADTGSAVRIDTLAGTVDMRFALNASNAPFSPFVVEDLAVMPGSPHTLAVARGSYYNGYSSAVALFDSGVQRPDTFNNLIANASYFRLAFAGASSIYTTEPLGFRIATVTGTGLTNQGTQYSAYTADFAVAGGHVFLATGEEMDPATGNLIGSFPASGYVVPDIANNRVYFLTGTSYGGYYLFFLRLRAFDLTTRNELWSVPFNTFLGYPKRMVSLGTNGLAFTTDANLAFVVRTGQLSQPQADVSLQPAAVPSPLILSNGTASYTFTVANSGPWLATGVVLSNPVPPGAVFVSASSSVGTCVFTNGSVICALGTMTNGASASISLTLQPVASGVLTNSTFVSLNEFDPNISNNVAVVQTVISPIPTPPTVSIVDGVALKPDFGQSVISFPVTLSGSSPLPISVNYQTADGSGVAGTNYVAANGTLTFSPGQTNKSLSLNIVRGNTLVESNRYFLVNLTAFTNVSPGRTQAIATILEDHFTAVQITGTNVVKGSSGFSNATFSLALSSSNTQPVSVQYQTVAGTAMPGSDYVGKAGALVFPAGTTNLSLTVPIFGNNLVTSNKTFFVLLSQPGNAILAVDQAQATIINTNAFPQLAILELQWQGTSVWITFKTVQNSVYRLDRASSLESGVWTAVTNQIVGTGQTMAVMDPATPYPQKNAFYRLVQLP